MVRNILIVCSFILLSSGIYANEAGKGQQPSWDEHIAQKKQKATDEMNKKIQDIETQFAQKSATPTVQQQQIKDNAIAYERQKNDDLLSFVDTLKNMSESERQNAWQSFNMKQKSNYEAFEAKQKSLWQQPGSEKKNK